MFAVNGVLGGAECCCIIPADTGNFRFRNWTKSCKFPTEEIMGA